MAAAVEVSSGGELVASGVGVETMVGSVDSAEVMVVTVPIAGRRVSSAQAVVMSSVEADISDTGETEFKSVTKASDTVVEVESVGKME